MNDHVRVESAVSATSSGNLTWEKWPFDVATALGFSGQRNPLGFAVVRFLSDTPSSVEVWNIVLLLATILMKTKGLPQDVAREMAFQGFEWWRDSRCINCTGRGVIDTAQRTCPRCHGNGRRRMPEHPATVRDAISLLIEAEQWMEGQLAARLKGTTYQTSDDGCKVNLPLKDSQSDHGFNHKPVTPMRSTGNKGG
jgi:hypothetical protein